MWKHSWSAYLGGASLSHRQLATALLWAVGRFMCDGDEVILQGHCCGRYHVWHSFFFYKGTCVCLNISPAMCIGLHSPTVLCHRLTANRRLQVTVTTAGMVRWGRVLAATCVTGELDGNFSTMMTSCCIWSLNIRGLCGRKHYWVEERKECGEGWRDVTVGEGGRTEAEEGEGAGR